MPATLAHPGQSSSHRWLLAQSRRFPGLPRVGACNSLPKREIISTRFDMDTGGGASCPGSLRARPCGLPWVPASPYFPFHGRRSPKQQRWVRRSDWRGLPPSRARLVRLRHVEVAPCSRPTARGWRGAVCSGGEQRPLQLVDGQRWDVLYQCCGDYW